MNDTIFDFLQKGVIQEWKKHPAYEGVMLAEVKYDYAQSWRILLVKVDGGKGMLPHIHESETEIHFVLNGSAAARVGKETMEYTAGQICRIPCGTEHEVRAGTEGLTMAALFLKE